MILFLILNLINSLLQGFLNALPQWTFSIASNNYIMAIIRYCSYMNTYVPISDGFLPILAIYSTILAFFLGRRVLFICLNYLRGAGAS